MIFPHIHERYQFDKILGQGRLSTVYRGYDTQTGQTVALKVLQPHLRAQPLIVQRFRREMAAVQRLDHEAIVRVYDIIETVEHMALVMEYARGQDLKSWVQKHGTMAPTRVEKLAQVLLEALDEAHSRGVLHRDLNLANVIFDEESGDRVEIIGFGLARVDEMVSLTMHTRVLGSLETMAPEAVLGKTVDAQADLFSLGAILYQLVTGRALHDGRMSSALFFASGTNYLEDVRSRLQAVLGEDYPSLFQTIVRALMPDPTLRFATANQMLDALAGDYHDGNWQALQVKHAGDCTKCGRERIEGLATCIYCGHAPERLIKNPGEGEHVVQILTSGPLFFGNFQGRTSQAQLQALYKVIFSHEDTGRVFYASSDDEFAPYIFADQLTLEDAQRIEVLLKAEGVACQALHASELRPFSSVANSLSTVQRLGHQGVILLQRALGFLGFLLAVTIAFGMGTLFTTLIISEIYQYFNDTIVGLVAESNLLGAVGPFLLLNTLMILSLFPLVFGLNLLIQAIVWLFTPKRQQKILTLQNFLVSWPHPEFRTELKNPVYQVLAFLGVLLSLHFVSNTIVLLAGIFSLSYLTWMMALSCLALVAGAGMGFVYRRRLRQHFSLVKRPESRRFGSFSTVAKIPAASLMNDDFSGILQQVMPASVQKSLRAIPESALQQHVHELLTLILTLFRDKRVSAITLQDVLKPLWVHVLSLIDKLSKLQQTICADSTDTILNRLAIIDAELETTLETGDTEALLAERQRYLSELDVLDQSVYQANLVQGELLQVRATLIDLQSQFSQPTLPSLEQVHYEISELKIRFETRQELYELLEAK